MSEYIFLHRCIRMSLFDSDLHEHVDSLLVLGVVSVSQGSEWLGEALTLKRADLKELKA